MNYTGTNFFTPKILLLFKYKNYPASNTLALDSVVAKTEIMLTSHGGFLAIEMYHHRAAI